MKKITSKKLAKINRYEIIKLSNKANTPHLASSLSCIDIITVIYNDILNINSNNLNKLSRDHFILSKGHAATALYVTLKTFKFISKKQFNSYAKENSYLEEHPSPKIKGVEAATGSLGHGLPIGCGIALAKKIKKIKSKVYVLLGDGECNEGSVWEAALFGSAKKLNNLICIVDANKLQGIGKTNEILSITALGKKFKSFGWNTIVIDGHNHSILKKELQKNNSKKPKMIIANTIKGKGISFMENDNNWHYRIPSKEEVLKSKIELKL